MKIIRPQTITDSMLTSNVSATDYTAYNPTKVYLLGTRVQFDITDFHHNYESLTGSASAVTLTVAAPCVVTWTAHGRSANDPISFTTTGALPTGLTVGIVYYVLSPVVNSFNVSTTAGGSAITTTGTQSGVHTATSSINYAKTPNTNPTVWLDLGVTNRYSLYDQSVTSQTSNLSTIDNSVVTVGRVDSVVILNCSAASVRIKQTDSLEGVVYDKTTSLVSDSGITDWYAYFMEPIDRTSDKAFTDLLPYANSVVEVILSDAGNTVLCGGTIIGLSKDISSGGQGVEYGAKVSIQDYSIKTRDAFGNYTVLQRAFNKRADFTIYVESSLVDTTQKLLSEYRSTPVVYIGGGGYSANVIYGFYKDFSIDISYPTLAVCTIQIEGLT